MTTWDHSEHCWIQCLCFCHFIKINIYICAAHVMSSHALMQFLYLNLVIHTFSGYIPTSSQQYQVSWGGCQHYHLFSHLLFTVWWMLSATSFLLPIWRCLFFCCFHCLILCVVFFFQIAFSQHNSIMDLVQFFVTFFRWVLWHYRQWQVPQARILTPAQCWSSTSAQQWQAFRELCI